MSQVVKIDDHAQAAIDRFTEVFKKRERIQGFSSAYADQIQNIEDAVFDIKALLSVANATGALLDIFGEIVGEPRNGRNDDSYRIRIYARIGINTSQGLPENLIAVFNLVSGTDNCHYIPYYPGAVMIMSGSLPLIGGELLQDGDMEQVGTGAWAFVNSATLTKQNTDPQAGLQYLRVAYNGVANPGARQSVLTIGNYYRVNGYTRTQDLLGQIPVIKNGAGIIYQGSSNINWYEFDFIFQAADTTIIFGSNATAADYVEYDSLSVQQFDYDTQQDIYEICQQVVAGGIRVLPIGVYIDGEAFSFDGDPNGLGFDEGKFAGLTV